MSINKGPDDEESRPLLAKESAPPSIHEQLKSPKKFSKLDIAVGVVYVAHLIGMIVLSVFTFHRAKHNHSESVEAEFKWFVGWAGLSSAAAIVFSFAMKVAAFFGFAAWMPPRVVLSLGGGAAAIAVGVKFLAMPVSIVVIVGGGVIILVELIILYVLVKVPATRTQLDGVLKSSVRMILARPVILLINFVAVLVSCVVIGYGLYLVHQILIRWEGWRAVLFAVLTAISMIWNVRLVGFVSYMTCCGGIASWYFSLHPSEDRRLKHATLKALARALSRSLGSLALASFLFAVVTVLTLVLSFSKSCKKCSKSLRKRLAKYVNVYAIVNMALFGNSFMKAAKAASKTTEQHSKSGEHTLDIYTIFYAIGVGMTCASVTLAVTKEKFSTYDYYSLNPNSYLFLTFVAVLLISYWIAYVAFQPLHAAYTSTFYCFCEEPELIQYCDTHIVERFKKVQPKKNTTVSASPAAATTKKTTAKAAAAKKTAPAKPKASAAAAAAAKKTVPAKATAKATAVASVPSAPQAGAPATMENPDVPM